MADQLLLGLAIENCTHRALHYRITPDREEGLRLEIFDAPEKGAHSLLPSEGAHGGMARVAYCPECRKTHPLFAHSPSL